jgi:hypothetical protein
MNKLCHTQDEWRPGLYWNGCNNSLTQNLVAALDAGRSGHPPGPFAESYVGPTPGYLKHVTVTDMRDGTVYVIGQAGHVANKRRTKAIEMLNICYWHERLGEAGDDTL